MRVFQPQYIDCVILCGGNVKTKHGGSEKLQCMLNVERRPFLSYIIDQLSAFSFSKIILAVDSNCKDIQDYFGNRYAFVDIKYSHGDELLGTIGAVKKAIINYGENNEILIVKGNSYTNIDIFDMRNFYSFFDFKEEMCCLSYKDKSRLKILPNREIPDKELYSAGFYILNKEELLSYPDECSFKDIKIKNNFILNRKKNKTIDINITPNNHRNIKLFFRSIWGYDWSRFEEEPCDDSLKECLYCKYSQRIILGKYKYHGWKHKCLLKEKLVSRRSVCEHFEPKGNKPYYRFGYRITQQNEDN